MSIILEGPSIDKLPDLSAEDWGIESDDIGEDLCTSGSDADNDENMRDLPNSVTEAPIVCPRPLKLGRNHHSYTQGIRFRRLLRSLLNQRVNLEETSRFLEQFQFGIISSGLLEAQPIYSCWSRPENLGETPSLTSKAKPWTRLYVHRIASFGGSATLGAVTYYLHLRYRSSTSRSERTAVALVIFMSVFLYLWATRKRRLIRTSREKALVYIDMAAHSAKYLDGDMVRATKRLQEIELCHNGFGVDSLPSFVCNDNLFRERSTELSAVRKFRSQLASSLMLVFNSYWNALQECVGAADPELFRKYETLYCLEEARKLYDVKVKYDHTMSINYSNSEFFELSESICCLAPVKKFKRLLQELHFIRRLFFCTLLSINLPSSTPVAECRNWNLILRNLSHLHHLSQELSRLLSRDSLGQLNEATPSGTNAVAKPLIETASLMRHLSARLEILSESSANSPDYNAKVRAITSEMDELKLKWEAFLKFRENQSTSSGDDFNKAQPNDSTHVDMASTTSFENLSNISSQPPTELDTYNSYDDQRDINNLLVFEGEAPLLLTTQNSKLTREERIAFVRNNRSDSKARDVDPSAAFAEELSQVMISRKIAINKC